MVARKKLDRVWIDEMIASGNRLIIVDYDLYIEVSVMTKDYKVISVTHHYR